MSEPARRPGLDLLRALAILAVVFFHEGWRDPLLAPVVQYGWMGVDLFFVLSGFLIGGQLLRADALRDAGALAGFCLRRAFRILPAYWLVLAAYVFWPAFREAPGLGPPWQFLSFTENLLVDYAKNAAFSHAWSLCVEEHFYLALPLLVMLLRRRASARMAALLFAGCLLAGIAVRGWAWHHALAPLRGDAFVIRYIETIYYPTYARLDGLAAGVGLAVLQARRPSAWRWLMAHGNALLLGGAALLALAVWAFSDRFGYWPALLGFPFLAVALGLLVAGAACPDSLLGRCRVPGAGLLAALSYSLYLTHKGVIHVLREGWVVPLDAGRWTAFAIYAAGALGVAALLYLLVERPCLRWRDRLLRRSAAAAFA